MANFDEMSFAVNELSGGKNVVIMDDLDVFATILLIALYCLIVISTPVQ